MSLYVPDVFIPSPNDLLVSVTQCKDNIKQLLTQLPTKFLNTSVNHSALGAALQAAHKLLAPIGGRITVFQTCLPTVSSLDSADVFDFNFHV
jgi:protein transport protein SEC24